jgi:hypothetical protein
MGVQITIRPHVVRNAKGEEVEFDQFQILCGQRVCGYLGKLPSCLPKLVVRELPQDVMKAIVRAAHAQLRELHPQGELVIERVHEAIVAPAIGDKPKKQQLPVADAAASAELEQALESQPADGAHAATE